MSQILALESCYFVFKIWSDGNYVPSEVWWLLLNFVNKKNIVGSFIVKAPVIFKFIKGSPPGYFFFTPGYLITLTWNLVLVLKFSDKVIFCKGFTFIPCLDAEKWGGRVHFFYVCYVREEVCALKKKLQLRITIFKTDMIENL